MFFNLKNYGFGERTVLLRNALRYFSQYAQKVRLPRAIGADEQRKGRQRDGRLPDGAVVFYGNVGKQDGSRPDAKRGLAECGFVVGRVLSMQKTNPTVEQAEPRCVHPKAGRRGPPPSTSGCTALPLTSTTTPVHGTGGEVILYRLARCQLAPAFTDRGAIPAQFASGLALSAIAEGSRDPCHEQASVAAFKFVGGVDVEPLQFVGQFHRRLGRSQQKTTSTRNEQLFSRNGLSLLYQCKKPTPVSRRGDGFF